MKRILLLTMILLSLFSLSARPTLVVAAAEEGASYNLVREVVERVATHSLLSRIDGEGELSVTVEGLVAEEANALTVDLLFSYEGSELQLCLNARGKGPRRLEKDLEEKLSSLLLYDGLTLIGTEPGLSIDHVYDRGYASLASLRRGEHYKGLDAEGSRWGSAVVQQVSEEEPVSLLVSTGGKKLLPGMRLAQQKGKSVGLSFSSLLSAGRGFAVDASYSQDIGIHPFMLVLGSGIDLSGESLSPSNLYGRAGVAAALPLSMVFGLYSGFWRNSSLAMECSLGLGYSLSDGVLLYGSSALLTYSYRMQGYSLALGIGNKHWVSEQVSFSSGLFMQLGLAYTW